MGMSCANRTLVNHFGWHQNIYLAKSEYAIIIGIWKSTWEYLNKTSEKLQTPNLDISEGYPCLSRFNSLNKGPSDTWRQDVGFWNRSDTREAGPRRPDAEKV